jgi:hypothetical protein
MFTQALGYLSHAPRPTPRPHSHPSQISQKKIFFLSGERNLPFIYYTSHTLLLLLTHNNILWEFVVSQKKSKKIKKIKRKNNPSQSHTYTRTHTKGVGVFQTVCIPFEKLIISINSHSQKLSMSNMLLHSYYLISVPHWHCSKTKTEM